VNQEESQRLEAAWRAVLAGQTAAAESLYQKLLARRPGLLPAETGRAYARLRAGRVLDATRGFDSVLERRDDDLAALVGAASAAVRRGEPEAALAFYRRAAVAKPDDALVRRRLNEVKLQVTERGVAAARAALAAGERDHALEQYRHALDAAPELGGLRVELANLLVEQGDAAGAIAVLDADPTGDRQVLLRLGELATAHSDPGKALDAYRRLLARDPKDAETLRHAMAAREAVELQQLPEEYRRVFSSPRLTRADLAALVAIKVTALARAGQGEPQVAIDISGSWAREHIIRVLSLGIMEVYPNHTFQPGAIIRRGDLARAVARVLDLLRWPESATPALKDMSRNNLFYDAAARSVGAGLMDLTADGSFEPWRPVSGQDAAAVLTGLVRLVGP
jgi:tetratricopeptide (TPR) repeat protein